MAQFFKIVFPFALNAASKAFSVAPTEIDGNFIVEPLSLFLLQLLYIHFNFNFCTHFF